MNTITSKQEIDKGIPNGARFYKCALQLNPFEYLSRHNKTTEFTDEAAYNKAIIEACLANKIEVIAVTDHYRVQSAQTLMAAARAAGIQVIPGFEAVTKDGVHFICLFDPSKDPTSLERILGDCGIHHDEATSPTGRHDATELLTQAIGWPAVCIAAHITSDGGLLNKLSGQTRINAWTSKNLLACAIPGAVAEAPDNLRPILQNKNPEHRRERPIAVVNASDVTSPSDLSKPSASCWLKMSAISIEGVRQAFLDPESRVRLASDPGPEAHSEFVDMTWQGGFLDGAAIRFNENLNVLIGGRGTGKSTVIESIRYVLGLEPIGDEATNLHEAIVRNVLKSGTKISLQVRSHRPASRTYFIERTIPNPPIVKDETGQVLNLLPNELMAQVEVYGQHEISELTKSPEKLTRLLARFVEEDNDTPGRKSEIKQHLDRSRMKVLELRKELQQIEERLAALPALEETLRSFQKAGVETKLKERDQLVREERVLKSADERLRPFEEILAQMKRAVPLDIAFISDKALEGLPGQNTLKEIGPVLDLFGAGFKTTTQQLENNLAQAKVGLATIRTTWDQRKTAVITAYESILRELQRAKVDGAEFIRLRSQIEELRPMKDRQALLQRTFKEHEQQRRNLLAEWEDVKAEEFRRLEKAAKRVSKKLLDRVLVEVASGGNREPVCALLKEWVGGRLSESFDAIKKQQDFSLTAFAEACRGGRGILSAKYSIPAQQADHITQATPEVIMQIEELELPPTTTVKLNVAAEGQPAQWQTLEQLSSGQKATAVLLLLLLESQAPLVVDQPEDDLDNRFITDGVVPKMREEKRRRQFLFATHNANIPVLGDAELIIGLSACSESGEGKARMPREHMGSMDIQPVRELVEEVLEGGRVAFEERRLKYGF